MSTPATLAERITSVLVAAGFTKHDGISKALDPEFTVTGGVGATVGVAWWDACQHDQLNMLTEYAHALYAAGLGVENRDTYLYVAEVQS